MDSLRYHRQWAPLPATAQPIRPALAVIGGLAAFLLLVSVSTAVILGAGWALRGEPGTFADYTQRAVMFEYVEGMVAAHVGLGLLIVAAWGIARLTCGMSFRELVSVRPGVRWGYAAWLALVVTVVLIPVGVFSAPGPLDADAQPHLVWVLAVVVFTSPFQAAGEEFLFRGLLLLGVGAYARSAWWPIVASAVLFALLHGTQNPALFVDRLAFGLLAGWLVIATGGLEAGIVIHVVNNVVAFAVAALTTGIATARTTTEVTWTRAAFDVALFAALAGIAWWLARRRRLATTTAAELVPGASVR